MAGFLCEFQGSELRSSSCVVRLLFIIPSYTGLRSRSEVLSILALVFIYLGGGWFWGNKAGVPSKTSHKAWPMKAEEKKRWASQDGFQSGLWELRWLTLVKMVSYVPLSELCWIFWRQILAVNLIHLGRGVLNCGISFIRGRRSSCWIAEQTVKMGHCLPCLPAAPDWFNKEQNGQQLDKRG